MRGRLRWMVWLGSAMVVLAVASWPFLSVMAQAPHDFELTEIGSNKIAVTAKPTYSNLIRVDLKSRADLQSLATKYKLFIYETVSPCNNGEIDRSRELWSDMSPGNWIYDGIGAVDLWSRAPDGEAYRTLPSGPKDADGKIRYAFFFNPEFHLAPNIPKDDPHEPLGQQYEYDLRKNPADLCVRVFGRGNFGFGEPFPTITFFQSNVVVIPGKLVAAEIDKYKSE